MLEPSIENSNDQTLRKAVFILVNRGFLLRFDPHRIGSPGVDPGLSSEGTGGSSIFEDDGYCSHTLEVSSKSTNRDISANNFMLNSFSDWQSLVDAVVLSQAPGALVPLHAYRCQDSTNRPDADTSSPSRRSRSRRHTTTSIGDF